MADIGFTRVFPVIAGIVVASAAFAANVTQQVQYHANDSFAVLTTVEGYTPEDHKQILAMYEKRDQLVFVPVDFAVRAFEEGLRTPEAINNPHWTGYTRSADGQLTAANGVKAPIGSSEVAAKISTRPGKLYLTGDLLSYYQETVVPGAVIDETLRSYRGPLMNKEAIQKEIARRDAGETMKLWPDFQGLQQDNVLQYLDFVSLKMLLAAAEGSGATWTRHADVATCMVPMTDNDARDLKRSCEWWLAKSRRDHSYQGQLQRGYAAIFQVSMHLSPINGKGLQFTINMPESIQAFSNQATIQSDTRGGEVLSAGKSYKRYANYAAVKQMLAANPQAEVNWTVSDRDALVTQYGTGALEFSAAAETPAQK